MGQNEQDDDSSHSTLLLARSLAHPICLTLILAIRCQDGNLIASDSRATYSLDIPLMREADQKLQIVDARFCLGTLGAFALASKAIESIEGQVLSKKIVSSKGFIDLCEEATFQITKKYGERIAFAKITQDYDPEEYDFSLVCATAEGVFEIRLEGISEKFSD